MDGNEAATGIVISGAMGFLFTLMSYGTVVQSKIASMKNLTKLQKLAKKVSTYEDQLTKDLSVKKLARIDSRRMRAQDNMESFWENLKPLHFAKFHEYKGTTILYETDSYENAKEFADYIVNGSSFKGYAKPVEVKTPAEEIIKETSELLITPQAISS